MAVRTALLTSKNINLDTDFSKYIETVSEPGVITGFAVTSSSVATGQARVPCERTNGETIYAFVQNFNSVSISGDGYVIVSIPQNIIDNGGGNEDGTGIATIEVVNSLPAKNYLLLATITSGDVEDNRNMIPKVGELKTDIDSIFASIEDLDERVEALEEAGAIDHLEEMALVGEKYALTDTLFKQLTPKLSDCTVDANVGDVAANTEIHIQRQGSKTPSNKLKLKLKAVGSPTTSVVVEVRKGIQVDVSSSEAYWYGDENNIIATGSLTSSSFTTDYAEVEFTLDANFGGNEGELLDVVVYQSAGSGATVNASNYYVLACDSTQWSEAFSYVKVNGSTRSREKLMPYCVSDGFVQAMLSKVSSDSVTYSNQYTQLVYSHEISGSLIIGLNYDTLKVDLNITTYNSAVKLYISDNEFGTFNIDATKTYSAIGNYSDTISKNALYTMAIASASSNKGTINIYVKPTIYKKGNGVLGKPINLSLIGENTSINIFGEENIKELAYTLPCIGEKNGNEVARVGSTTGSNYVYNNYAFYFCKETGYYKLKTVNVAYNINSAGYMFIMDSNKYYDQSLQFLTTYAAYNSDRLTAQDTTLLLEKGTIIGFNNPGTAVAFRYSVQPITIKKVKI